MICHCMKTSQKSTGMLVNQERDTATLVPDIIAKRTENRETAYEARLLMIEGRAVPTSTPTVANMAMLQHGRGMVNPAATEQ